MRGGTSKGIFFHSSDLPRDVLLRDKVLKWVMGAYGDPRQIDGLGGGHVLTSKIAIIEKSSTHDCDLNFTFIQAIVGDERLDETPNCGNILSAVGPYGLETDLLKVDGNEANVRIFMTNSGKFCSQHFFIRNGKPIYNGDTKIDGVFGTGSPILCQYEKIAGSICGKLFPTGSPRDRVDGVNVSCIDNGMPVVVMLANELGISGKESPKALNTNKILKQKIEDLRLVCGKKMGLGNVSHKAVPKMCIVSEACYGGTIMTRTFIPWTCHEAIGVLGAISVATAVIFPESPAHFIANVPSGKLKYLSIEHPSGSFDLQLSVSDTGNNLEIDRVALVRTARLISSGQVYIPTEVWTGKH